MTNGNCDEVAVKDDGDADYYITIDQYLKDIAVISKNSTLL